MSRKIPPFPQLMCRPLNIPPRKDSVKSPEAAENLVPPLQQLRLEEQSSVLTATLMVATQHSHPPTWGQLRQLSDQAQ